MKLLSRYMRAVKGRGLSTAQRYDTSKLGPDECQLPKCCGFLSKPGLHNPHARHVETHGDMFCKVHVWGTRNSLKQLCGRSFVEDMKSVKSRRSLWVLHVLCSKYDMLIGVWSDLEVILSCGGPCHMVL